MRECLPSKGNKHGQGREMIAVYITFANEAEAKNIGNALLNDRLVACINIFPVKSSYWWHDGIHNAEEVALIAKTKQENFDKIREVVRSMHSYETPAIVAFRIDSGDKDY